MRDFFVNLDANRADGGFVQSFSQNIPAVNLPQFARSDSFPIRVLFVRQTQDITANLPFYYVDPSGFSSVKFAGGEIGATPDGGTFTLTSSLGGTTGGIAYNAVAATTVQTAIQALTGLSAATVTGNAGGPYSVDSNQTTNASLAITASAAALAPDGSTVVIVKTQTANGSLTNRWNISLAKAYPILITAGWTALPAAAVTVTTVQAGSATQNKTFQVEWNADAYAGTVMLTFTGDTATGSIGPIGFSANPDQIAAAFAKHVDIALAANVGIVKNAPGKFTVTMLGAGIANSNTPALATSSNTLQVPVGLTAVATVSTAGADALLGSADSVDITIEVEVRESAGQPNTAAQATTQLLKDLIVNTPGMATGNEDWATIDDIEALTREDNTVFVDNEFGDNATALRQYPTLPYADPGVAKDDAVSGDLVYVRPHNFSNLAGNLAKDGVSWYLPAGTTLKNIGDLDTGVFDDTANGANGPVVFTIDGAGIIEYESTGETTGFVHAVNITNADSAVVIRCQEIIGDTNDDGSDSSGAVACFDGSLQITCEEIASTGKGYSVYWENGDMRVKAMRITGDGNACIASNIQSTPTGHFWVEAQQAICVGASSAITTAGNQSTARVWMHILEVSSASARTAVRTAGAEKVYLTAQKISNTGAASTVQLTAGEIWLKVDKITSDDTHLELTGGTSWIDLQELEVGSATAAYCIECTGGTHVIRGARFTGGATSLGINVTGGTLTLIDCYINTSANSSGNPITKSGGTLILQGSCALVAHASRDSIEAGTAQNVKVYGTSVASTAVDGNVTIQVGTLTVDANVT